jgi:hypothetical protein
MGRMQFAHTDGANAIWGNAIRPDDWNSFRKKNNLKINLMIQKRLL